MSGKDNRFNDASNKMKGMFDKLKKSVSETVSLFLFLQFFLIDIEIMKIIYVPIRIDSTSF